MMSLPSAHAAASTLLAILMFYGFASGRAKATAIDAGRLRSSRRNLTPMPRHLGLSFWAKVRLRLPL